MFIFAVVSSCVLILMLLSLGLVVPALGVGLVVGGLFVAEGTRA